MPTHFIYNDNRIIPAPFISLTRAYIRSDDQTILGSVWRGQIIGTIVSWAGSPNSSGVFWTLGGYPPNEDTITTSQMLTANIRKQEALRTLFSSKNDGGLLEVQGSDAQQPMKMNIRLGELTFEDGLWLNTVQWTLSFETDNITVNGIPIAEDVFDFYIDSASENWSIETDEATPEGVGIPRTYRLTHTVSAKGLRHFDETGTLTMPAWQQARGFVLERLGLDTAILNSQAIGDLSTYMALNHVRNENIDELGGEYSVSENWIVASGAALEDFTIETRQGVDTGRTTVAINGQIQGLEKRDANMNIISYKYDNSLAKFNSVSGDILPRAQLYSGYTLNVVPLSTSVGRNPVAGVITYNFEYDNRPSNLVPNARSESIVIQDNLATDVIAIVPVLARKVGPVLQDMQTSRERSRTLNIELVVNVPQNSGIIAMMNADPFINPATYSVLNDIIEAVNPLNSYGAYVSYLTENTKNWEPKEGRASCTKTWIYEI